MDFKMSHTVNLLKIFIENKDFLSQANQYYILIAVNKANKYDNYIKEIVNHFNEKKNIVLGGPETYKALTVPRFKILLALHARELKCIKPPIFQKLEMYLRTVTITKDVPKRFQEQFIKLLVPGFWLLGAVIEDSLSEDTSINCGNPFEFFPGDLGFWWAGAVIMDWVNVKHFKKDASYECCKDFYNDSCLSIKYKYCQRSALSHMGRIPEQFLSSEDEKNFQDTINSIDLSKLRLKLESFEMMIKYFTKGDLND